jgi:hypothetical protein
LKPNITNELADCVVAATVTAMVVVAMMVVGVFASVVPFALIIVMDDTVVPLIVEFELVLRADAPNDGGGDWPTDETFDTDVVADGGSAVVMAITGDGSETSR